MLTTRIFALFAFLSLLTTSTFAQATKPPLDKALEQKSVNLLREIIGDIKDLKSPVNRFYFSSEAASMLWKYDEKQSRQIFEGLMAQTRGQIKEFLVDFKKPDAVMPEDPDSPYTYASNALPRAQSKQKPKGQLNPKLATKLSSINQMRVSLIYALARQDPAMAYLFYRETDEALAESLKYRNDYSLMFLFRQDHNNLEVKMIEALLSKKDRDKTLELARYMISKGLFGELTTIIKMIAAKYFNDARLLAGETYQAITKAGPDKPELRYLKSFYDMARQGTLDNTKQPMLNDSDLRGLAKMIGEAVLANKADAYMYPSALSYAKGIEKYAPTEAARIRRKFGKKGRKESGNYYDDFDDEVNSAANAAARAVANAANSVANNKAANTAAARAIANAVNAASNAANTAANAASARRTSSAKKGKRKVTTVPEPEPKSAWQIKAEKRQALLERLKAKIQTAEDRKGLLAECRKFAASENWLSPFQAESGVMIVSTLVEFAMTTTDNELSDELLKEASTVIPAKLVTFSDYGARLMLAVGYSERNPGKAFELLESMTSINEVIASAIKVGEFIDITTMFVTDGEANLGMLPISNITDEFFMRNHQTSFPNVLLNLAKADFERTRALANKFERPEVRITAKMLIAISILHPPEVAETFDEPIREPIQTKGIGMFGVTPSASR